MIVAQPDVILGYLPLYIAKELFYDFQLLNTGNDDSAILAVKEERADISVGDPIMFPYVDYGKLKIVAGFITKGFNTLITFNPFLHDIKGKTIVTYPHPSTTWHFAEALAKEYDLTLIERPFNAELGPLLTQEADAGFILEPNQTLAMRNKARVLKSYFEESFAFTGFVGTKKDKKFFLAIQQAIDVFNNDAAKTLAIAKKYFSLDEDILAEAIEHYRQADMYRLLFTDKELENAFTLKGIRKENYKNYL